jgi:hypothetical protein
MDLAGTPTLHLDGELFNDNFQLLNSWAEACVVLHVARCVMLGQRLYFLRNEHALIRQCLRLRALAGTSTQQSDALFDAVVQHWNV